MDTTAGEIGRGAKEGWGEATEKSAHRLLTYLTPSTCRFAHCHPSLIAHRIRSNVNYLKSPNDNEKEGPSRFTYPAATVAVVYDKVKSSQVFYKAQTDEILSLAVHPGGVYVATGQRGNQAPVHVWNSATLETEAVLSLHTRGVSLLAWGEDGSRLVSVGVDDSHIVALWDWRMKKMVASGIGGDGLLLAVAISEDGKTIIAVGVKQVLFFTVEGRALRSKKGLIGKNSGGKKQVFSSCAFLNNDAYVGCASGEIYKFHSRKVVAIYQAHGISEPVNSLSRCAASGGLISGGEDGLVLIWDKSMKMVGSPTDMAEDVGEERVGTAGITTDCSVVSSQMSGNFVLLGTRGGDIFEVRKTDADSYVKKMVCSHGDKHANCLASHPSELVFASSGSDKTLRIWSVRRKVLVDMRILPVSGTALGFSSGSGESLCLGMSTGGVAIFDMMLNVINTFQHSNKAITCVKYSPDGNLLAVGSEDTNIYLYSVDRGYSRTGVCRGNLGPVIHLDFSTNSRFLQSNDTDHNIMFWNQWGDSVEFGGSDAKIERTR